MSDRYEEKFLARHALVRRLRELDERAEENDLAGSVYYWSGYRAALAAALLEIEDLAGALDAGYELDPRWWTE